MNVHLFSAGILALFTGLSVPCPPSGQTLTEVSRTRCVWSAEHRERIVSEECQDTEQTAAELRYTVSVSVA